MLAKIILFRPFYDDPPVVTPPVVTPPAKSFTQAEVDEIVNKRLNRHKGEQSKTLERLQELEKSQALTQEERDGLAEQIGNLQSTLMSKEELSAKELKKREEKYNQELKKHQEDATKWRTMFTESTIQQSLISEASSEEALYPDQIYGLLRNDTRLVEVLGDDGKPSGRLVPQVKFQGIDKDGKPTILDLPVKDAIKQMKEMPKFGNLFKSGAAGGLGGTNTGAGPKANLAETLKDPAKYAEWRKTHSLSELPI